MAAETHAAELALDQACPSCAARCEPGQEYCLECGARIVRPRRAVHWAWPSLLALAVAAGAAAGAVAVARGGGGGTVTIVATSRLVPVPARAAPAGAKAPPGQKRAAPRPAPKPAALGAWPGRDAYTVVLASLPPSAGVEAAREKAREARRAGLPRVGVLASADYPSLHPGYHVVFSGVYATLAEAESAVPAAASVFPGAHARRIAR